LLFIECHCIHFCFDKHHPASFCLAFFVECSFFLIKVNKVGFCSILAPSLVLQTVLCKVAQLTTREAGIVVPLSCIGDIGSFSPLFSGVSSSSGSPISQLCPSYIHCHQSIVHSRWGVGRIVLPLLGCSIVMEIVVWPPVLERGKGYVSFWGLFSHQFPLSHSTMGGPFFDSIVSAVLQTNPLEFQTTNFTYPCAP
jgi:hypothetical protein